MTVLELKKEIDDYIEAGGDKYCRVFIDDPECGTPPFNLIQASEVLYKEFDDATGGLVIR